MRLPREPLPADLDPEVLVDALAALPLGVQALASHPMKTDKRGLGDVDVPVAFARLSIAPGDWVYADANGVIVAKARLL